MLFVMEFMMSLEGAFIITSRVKFDGSVRHSVRISLNSASCCASGISPNIRRYAVFSNPKPSRFLISVLML